MNDLGDLEEVFEKHLDVAGLDLCELADSFCNLVYSTDYRLYDGPKDLAALDRLTLGLASLDESVLDQMSGSARELLLMRFRVGTDDDANSMREFVSRSDGCYSRVFSEITSMASELRVIVDAVRREIETSDRKRRSLQLIEMDRLQVVEYAVDFWKRFGKREVPTAEIKPAQPFTKFLADLFLCFDLNSAPEKAFGSWLKQQRTPPLQAR